MEKKSVIILALFIILGIILNFLPHLDYSYPMHADEWTHMALAKNLTSSTLYFEKAPGKDLEIGFHLIIAFLNKIGISYLFIFRFFPVLMTILISLSVFLWVREISNEKAALFSVLFIALLNSNATLLGMVYFVPLSFGLLFIPFGLYLLETKSKWFFLLFTALLYIHPPSALAFLLLISITILYKRERVIQNFLLIAFGGALALPLYLDIFLKKGAETAKMLAYNTDYKTVFIPEYLGWIIFILAMAGIVFAIIRKKYLLLLYIIPLVALMLFYTISGIDIFVYYWRILMYFFIICSAFFGFACQEIMDFANQLDKKKWVYIITILLLAFILIPAVLHKIEANNKLYKIIDDKDYETFSWIKENTNPDAIAVLEPFKGYAFTPIAERRLYTKIVPGKSLFYEARNEEVNVFLNESCKNLSFLEINNISLIYGNCSNEKLQEVYPDVFVFGD